MIYQPPLELSFLNFSYRNSFEALSLWNVPIIENIQDHDAWSYTSQNISSLFWWAVRWKSWVVPHLLDFCYGTINLIEQQTCSDLEDKRSKLEKYTCHINMLTLKLVKTQKPNYFSYACIFLFSPLHFTRTPLLGLNTSHI